MRVLVQPAGVQKPGAGHDLDSPAQWLHSCTASNSYLDTRRPIHPTCASPLRLHMQGSRALPYWQNVSLRRLPETHVQPHQAQ